MLAWQVDNKTVTIITYFEGLKGKAQRQGSVPLTLIITSMRRGVKVLGYDALWTESEDLKKKKSYFEQIIFNNKCLEGKDWKKTWEDSSSKNKEYPCGWGRKWSSHYVHETFGLKPEMSAAFSMRLWLFLLLLQKYQRKMIKLNV